MQKETKSVEPDNSADKQRQRQQHQPVLRHAQPPDKDCRIQPAGFPADAIFEQQPQGCRQEQQVQHFAGGGGRLLPEKKFQSADPARQQNRQCAGPAAGVSQESSHGSNWTVRASKPMVRAAAAAENKFSSNGTQAAGKSRNGSVSSQSKGCPTIGVQSQPATFAVRDRLFNVTSWLKVTP